MVKTEIMTRSILEHQRVAGVGMVDILTEGVRPDQAGGETDPVSCEPQPTVEAEGDVHG